MTARLRVLLAVLLGSFVLSGCEFDVYQAPLPGGTDVGEDPLEITVQFTDVLDLVPQSTVKVNDVSVGKVTDIELDGYTATVTLEVRRDTRLPDNAVAELRQTSLLGEKFVSLGPPPTGSSDELLGDGDTIPLERSGRNPEVEEVLGALSLLLNGGGVAQLKTIASEVNEALEGREDSAKSVLNQIRIFVSQLDDNKQDIIAAIESLNQLAIEVDAQLPTIDAALDELPSALDSLDSQREDLVAMLQALNELGDVGVRVIKESKDVTIDSIRQLQPVLTELANSGDDFVDAFHVFLTYPFVDEVVGRDPQVARTLQMGDYTNLSITLDIDLTDGLPDPPGVPNIPCIELEQIPDEGPIPPLGELCESAVDAINQCLQDPSPEFCADLPEVVQDAACEIVPIPGLCPGGGGGGGGNGAGGLPVPDLPVPGLPGLGGVLGDVLGRPGFGATLPSGPGYGPSMAQLSAVFDPALVSLLVPPMVLPAGGEKP